MSSLKQLRTRIKSVRSTQKITKAMNMVAAAKLKQMMEQVTKVQDYTVVLDDLIKSIACNQNFYNLDSDIMQRFFYIAKNPKSVLLVVFSTERGLCGSFNASMIKAIKEDIALLKQKGKTVKLIIIGRKAYEALKADYADCISAYCQIIGRDIENFTITVKQKVQELFQEGIVDECYLYFYEFKNVIRQVLNKVQILPINLPNDSELEIDYQDIYEIEGKDCILNLIDLYLFSKINLAFIQNSTSEEAARTMATDNSTKNAGDLIDHLTLKFNRTRQAIITKELIEIISGAEAL